MKAFAIPAYHDARIRLNVKGRESGGLVRRADYRKTLEEVAGVVRDCVDENGKPLDIEITFTSPDDPLKISGWQTDIVVRFKRTVLGLYHPRFGEIGPVPYRRTGGHTGRYGVAYVKGQGIAKGDRGVFSTYDVVPTIRDLAERRPASTALGREIEAASHAT